MTDFVETLVKRMQLPLPGEAAQMKMAPLSAQVYRHIESNHKKAAVMVLLFIKDGAWHFALIKRTNHHPNDKHGGQLGLPGGKLELSDAGDLLLCAMRETEEEIGIHANKIQCVGSLTPIYIAVSNFHVFPYIGIVQGLQLFSPQWNEVEKIFEVPIEHLLDQKNKGKTQLYVRDKLLPQVPHYLIEDQILWGATAMILSEFEHILQDVFK